MTLQEKKQFDHLKALANYKRVGVGPEALLFKKMLDRRKAVRSNSNTSHILTSSLVQEIWYIISCSFADYSWLVYSYEKLQ